MAAFWEMAVAEGDLGALKLGKLPEWNLADLYAGPQDPALERDFRWGEEEAKAFRQAYEGKLAGLPGKDLATALKRYEALQEKLGRIGSYAQLLYSGNQSDPQIGRFYQGISERANRLGSDLLFFGLELRRLEDAELAPKLADPAMAHWRPWLRDLRVWRPHDLPQDQERLLHERSVVGAAAWTRLFDETMADLRFPLDGQQLTSAEILNRFTDRNPKVREAAAHAFAKVLGDNARLFALITNTLAKDKAIDDEWRRQPRPVSARNLSNLVEDEVVDALVTAVTAAYPKLSHRYYALKARWLGHDLLPYWERNAPLPEDEDRLIAWPEAERTVLDAYNDFSPDLAALGRRFFENAWIDAPVRPGKASGAFAHPVVPSVHPYLLLNYQGKVRDVMTLAHELGHGVHQVLAAKQGPLMADTPLTLAETASVFGEMLTFQSLLRTAPDARTRKAMLAGKVEDMLNTVVRQIAFYDFETRLHAERRKGELTPDAIGAIWMAVQSESLGPAFTFDDEYKHYWSYIGHFIHSPFYVYAYAFGDCLVNSLYAAYQSGLPDFQAKYLDMLKAGGVKRHKELLAPFGLDASDPAFWDKGLGVISGFVDELEKF